SVTIATRSAHEMRPDPSRIVLRPFLLEPGPETAPRLERIVGRVLDMPQAVVDALVAELLERHQGRHADLEGTWTTHLELGGDRSQAVAAIGDPSRRLLFGAL